jgi:hypothetical protein
MKQILLNTIRRIIGTKHLIKIIKDLQDKIDLLSNMQESQYYIDPIKHLIKIIKDLQDKIDLPAYPLD